MHLKTLNIRWCIISYALVIAVMLLQTPVHNMGTICALGTMGFTAFCVLLTRKNKTISSTPNILLIFTIYIALQIGLSPYSNISNSMKFVAQAFLTYLLFRIHLTRKEHRFLVYAYELFISIWSIFIIHSCAKSSLYRHIHGSIELFGSEIDPNYIGIPIVSATILLLNDILNQKNKKILILLIVGFILNSIAIIETSSRGNLFSFVLGNGLIIINFLKVTKSSLKKYFLLIIVFSGLLYFFRYLSNIYVDHFARMAEVDAESGGRLGLWIDSIELWLDDFFTFFVGNGYGAVASIGNSALCSHNTYLQLLSETGIIGFMLFIIFIWKMFKKCYLADKALALVLLTSCFQIFFLNALDNRCVWGLLGWIAMIPNTKHNY